MGVVNLALQLHSQPLSLIISNFAETLRQLWGEGLFVEKKSRQLCHKAPAAEERFNYSLRVKSRRLIL